MGNNDAAEARAREILRAHGIGDAEATTAARVIVDLPPEAWGQLFLTREEVAHQVGISVSGVTRREIHRNSAEGALPRLVKRGASGGRGMSLWLAPVTIEYYRQFPPRNE